MSSKKIPGADGVLRMDITHDDGKTAWGCSCIKSLSVLILKFTEKTTA